MESCEKGEILEKVVDPPPSSSLLLIFQIENYNLFIGISNWKMLKITGVRQQNPSFHPQIHPKNTSNPTLFTPYCQIHPRNSLLPATKFPYCTQKDCFSSFSENHEVNVYKGWGRFRPRRNTNFFYARCGSAINSISIKCLLFRFSMKTPPPLKCNQQALCCVW